MAGAGDRSRRLQKWGEVRAAFLALDAGNAACFRPSPAGRWLADLYELARRQLRGLGVSAVYGGEFCTFSRPERFFPTAARIAPGEWRV
ncbi:MAG: laccase domain-containing protein [Candidatus Competibacteraceae bacterium]